MALVCKKPCFGALGAVLEVQTLRWTKNWIRRVIPEDLVAAFTARTSSF